MPNANEVAESWSRIEAWLGRKAKRARKTLAPAAADEQIADAERALGVTLPDDVRVSYRLHDGAPESCLFPSAEPDEQGYSPLSLASVLEDRFEDDPAMDKYATVDPGVRAKHRHPAWVPVASNLGGDFLCVDLAPAAGGAAGQVIEWLHETGERKLVAPSLAAYLEALADELEAGTLKYDGENGVHRPPAPAKEQTPNEKLAEMEAWLRRADPERVGADPNLDRSDGTRRGNPEFDPEARLFAVLDRLDPEGRFFAPACDDHYRVAKRLLPGGTSALFYDRFAPRRRVGLNGYVLFPVPEVLEATKPHYVKCRDVVAFGLTPDGRRLCFDAFALNLDDALVPVFSVPADFDFAKATEKQRKAAAKRVAKNIARFFEIVAADGEPAQVEFV